MAPHFVIVMTSESALYCIVRNIREAPFETPRKMRVDACTWRTRRTRPVWCAYEKRKMAIHGRCVQNRHRALTADFPFAVITGRKRRFRYCYYYYYITPTISRIFSCDSLLTF